MAFRSRKFSRRMGRRRRLRPETYTLVECDGCHNVWQDATCTGPKVDVFELMTMRTPRSTTDTTEVSNPSDKFIVVDGIKFQQEYWNDPNETLDAPGADPPPTTVSFVLTIWEAIMVLPFAQGSLVPAYVPLLTNPVFQGGDSADRVLWKRITHNPIWATPVFGGVNLPQLQFTDRDTAHGPQVVKARVRLDDRHGLYMVRNFTHNVVTQVNGESPACFFPGASTVAIHDNSWWKIFYHTRK